MSSPTALACCRHAKRIKTDEEEQQFILTGTCRVEDITADDTVTSTQLYDLELQKKNFMHGDVRQAYRLRGIDWAKAELDVINPLHESIIANC